MERKKINSAKQELQRFKISLEEERCPIKEQQKLELTKNERDELLDLQTKLKEEIDDLRAQKQELLKEVDELNVEKENFERDWQIRNEKT